jgi:hypothetical protein
LQTEIEKEEEGWVFWAFLCWFWLVEMQKKGEYSSSFVLLFFCKRGRDGLFAAMDRTEK